MPRNDAAELGHVCPGIRIHAIDIVQPPGIGILPIADMDPHQTIVTAALAAKSSAETPKKARWEARWEARSETQRREISGPPVAPTTPTTSLSASRTRRGGATRHPSRCAPRRLREALSDVVGVVGATGGPEISRRDRKSTRLNSRH